MTRNRLAMYVVLAVAGIGLLVAGVPPSRVFLIALVVYLVMMHMGGHGGHGGGHGGQGGTHGAGHVGPGDGGVRNPDPDDEVPVSAAGSADQSQHRQPR